MLNGTFVPSDSVINDTCNFIKAYKQYGNIHLIDKEGDVIIRFKTNRESWKKDVNLQPYMAIILNTSKQLENINFYVEYFST